MEPIKDLIVVRAGPGSLHQTWLGNDKPRSWDLFVCPYEEIASAVIFTPAVIIGEVIPGAKWAGLRALLNKWQGWRNYRYVMLADDDLSADCDTWARFFDNCARYGAKLAAPGLTHDSPFNHPMTISNSEFVARRVSFIEIMMPCFRVDVLSDLLATLDLTDTGWGWGLDLLWAKRLRYKDMFVIDETPVVHTRPVDMNCNAELQDRCSEELRRIIRENNLPWALKTLSGFDAAGAEITENDPLFLYRLYRGYDRLFARYPKRFEQTFRQQITPLPEM